MDRSFFKVVNLNGEDSTMLRRETSSSCWAENGRGGGGDEED
ncbi:hypothetical protein SLEP1_g4682 [Rubroshorea leprosula]|uniref:Uncharacterized protein n=1 Tax=Rubroshorea leprosula TaxID=152421 RepID=A0AAV5HYD5_9ROSI|nr:hypothetical protein SLEP1_g4682 [Rubroshorea leprosula]